MKRIAAALVAVLAISGPLQAPAALHAAESTNPDYIEPAATYTEVPYYLNKLKEAGLEGDRVRLNKVIHDALVTADLSDRKVVKAMEPILVKVRDAIAAGLDRVYLEGQASWLASAVAYVDREKLRPIVDVPEMDWSQPQVVSQTGLRISTFPDRILLHEGDKTRTATESSNINEAVISPNGRKIAYFRTTDDLSKAEIWVVDTRKLTRKKIATAKSCLTLLFTPDSGRILFQEVPGAPNAESPVFSMGTGGGKPKEVARVRLLQTTVEKGAHKGNIVVYRAFTHHMGTTIRDCAAVMSPSGKEIGRIKNGPCR